MSYEEKANELLAEHQMIDGQSVDAKKVNLEAIMDLPLEISVEMASVRLPLATIIRLARGSVIDMDREADAEVDILANGRLFAHGEIVSVEGRLGVRLSDVVSPGKLLNDLS